MLAYYNQEAELTKTLFQTDYKDAKHKFEECSQLHGEYIAAIETNAGASMLMQQNFNISDAAIYGNNKAYYAAFLGTMETFRTSSDQEKDFSKKAAFCYAELNSQYENLAIALGMNDKFRLLDKQGSERVAPLVAKRETILADLQKRVDIFKAFRTLATGDNESIHALYKQMNYGDLVTLQSSSAELELEIESFQRERYTTLTRLFAEEFDQRLHRPFWKTLLLMFSA